MPTDRQPRRAATGDDELPPMRFVLAGDGPHGLSPGLTEGPALCGVEEPEPGWALCGFTSVLPERIGCEDCRGVASRIIEALREASALLAGGPPPVEAP